VRYIGFYNRVQLGRSPRLGQTSDLNGEKWNRIVARYNESDLNSVAHSNYPLDSRGSALRG
jgi:hypothetical protein